MPMHYDFNFCVSVRDLSMCECVCLFICVCFLCFSPAFSTFSLLILSYSSWFSYFILFYYLVLDASLLYISLCGATEFARCLRAQSVWVQFPTLTQQHTVIFNSTSKGSVGLFQPLHMSGSHIAYTQMCKQRIYT